MTDTQDELPGNPNAAKLGQVPGDLCKRYAHYHLHKGDLTYARVFLDEFERRRAAGEQPITVTSIALWHAALNSTMKCFGGSYARVKLYPDDIFEDGAERDSFDYLKNLRDKNISHDDNDWTQVSPWVMVAKPGIEPKVIRVDCAGLQASGASPVNISRLRGVIERALHYVEKVIIDEQAAIARSLEEWDHNQLLNLPAVTLTMPSDHSIGQTRNTPGR